ncbi:hypothetical protein [Thermoflexus sp.]|uniref:hypothetical protein n=1 Tax=Thermoflexus sp. TaxID=1969742 RepID=UPI001755C9D6|nr:hypothetical protein [Thermoflexus sp.]
MRRARWRVLLLTAMGLLAACARPSVPSEIPPDSSSALRWEATPATRLSDSSPEQGERQALPTAAPQGTAAPERVARQIYTSFRTIPSPCCPPRPLPEVITRLESMPGIRRILLEGDRLIVEYEPDQLTAEDLPVLFALQGLEVRP